MVAINTRLIRVPVGESLRTIALRELGDVFRWPELIEINQLRPPYIIESINPDDRLANTVMWGDTLLIPVGNPLVVEQLPAEIYGTDMALIGGYIDASTGDYLLIAGAANLKQALINRLQTALNELITHPGYGSNIDTALGMKIVPIVEMMVSGYILRCLKQEPRIDTINSINSTVDGDALNYAVEVTPVNSNSTLDLNLVYAMPR